MAVTTVLSSLSVRDFAYSQLLTQLSQYNSKQLVSDQKLAVGDYQQKVNSAKRTSAEWEGLRQDLDKARTFLSSLVSRVRNIENYVNDATTQAYGARNASATVEVWGYKATFDSKIRQVNTTADSASQSPNIIGNTEVSSYSYTTDIYGATATLSHHTLGTGYTIEDSDGKTWKRDPTTQLYLERFNSDGSSTGTKIDISTGITLVSYTASTGAISFTTEAGTSNEATYSGTLTATGLGVLDSWVYEGLTTDAGRTQALDDLHDAKDEVEVYLARYEAALAEAQYYDLHASEAVSGLNAKVSSLTASQLLALQELETGNQYVNGLNQALVESYAAVQYEYSKMLGVESNQLVQALLNTTA